MVSDEAEGLLGCHAKLIKCSHLGSSQAAASPVELHPALKGFKYRAQWQPEGATGF